MPIYVLLQQRDNDIVTIAFCCSVELLFLAFHFSITGFYLQVNSGAYLPNQSSFPPANTSAISVIFFPSASSRPNRILDFCGFKYPLAMYKEHLLDTLVSGASDVNQVYTFAKVPGLVPGCQKLVFLSGTCWTTRSGGMFRWLETAARNWSSLQIHTDSALYI